jgi:hypothetical protein
MTENTTPIDDRPLMARLGNSGKLLLFGGLIGVLIGFLPMAKPNGSTGGSLSSMNLNMPDINLDLTGMLGSLGTNQASKVKVIEDPRGIGCVLAYVMSIFFAFYFHSPRKSYTLGWVWIALLNGVLTAFTAIWILFSPPSAGGGLMDILGSGGSKMSLSYGAFLNLIPAFATAAGGFIMAKKERLL